MRIGIGTDMVPADPFVRLDVVGGSCLAWLCTSLQGLEARIALDPCRLGLGCGASVLASITSKGQSGQRFH